MSFQQFILILKARRKTFFYTLLVIMALTLLFSLMWPKSYTAKTAIVVNFKPLDPLTGEPMGAEGSQSLAYLLTQIEIISDERVAGKVVKDLGLDQNPGAIREWRADTDGKGDVVVWLSHLLLKKLDVKPERDSNVLDIEYSAKDPVLAAAVANSFARAYVETTLELKVEPARQYATWFVERSKALREELEKAQTKLSEKQRDEGIVSIDERLDVENARLAELSSQLTVANGMTAETESRLEQTKGDTSILPEVMQSALLQSLKTQIASDDAKLQQLASQLGKNHPQYKRSEVELESLRKKLDFETEKLASSIGTANRVNLQRQAEIKDSLDKQKAKVLELKRQRDEVAVLQREVESAQKSYDIVMQRLTQSNLESESSLTDSVVILHPASEPVEPSFPKVPFNMVLSVLIGIPIAVALAFWREMSDYKIRVAEDIIELLDVPVLGTIEKPSVRRKRDRRKILGRWFARFRPVRT